MNWDEMAVVGRVARPHGLRGQVVVNLETDFPQERFRAGAALFVLRGGSVETVLVTTVRFHQDRPVIGLEGIDDVDDARALAGTELRVPLDTLTPLPTGTFYRHDLIGCSVDTTSGERVGVVTDISGESEGSCLVVDAAGGEVLVPMAGHICRVVDVAGKRIVIEPPEGLLEVNRRSGSGH